MTTTTQETPSVGELLKEARNGGPKAPIYRKLGVSPQTYDTWEGDTYTPGDEYAEALSEHFERELREVVWILYRQRARKSMGGYVALFAQPIPALAA